jgi:hypothetical protein
MDALKVEVGGVVVALSVGEAERLGELLLQLAQDERRALEACPVCGEVDGHDYEDHDYYESQAEESDADELGAQLGDPRRCPRHPNEKTSSPDGMFDAPCAACEWEDYAASQEEASASVPTCANGTRGCEGVPSVLPCIDCLHGKPVRMVSLRDLPFDDLPF